MALIGSIVANAAIDTKKWAAGKEKLTKTVGELKSTFSTLQSHFSAVHGHLVALGAAIGAGAAVAGIAALSAQQNEMIAVTARLAQRIGTTTEAISGLAYAASTFGFHDIEAFGDALSDMQEKIGDVTLEEGGAKDIMKMVGLDAQSMKTKDAVENFKLVAEAIRNTQSQAERLHIADTMLGGEGQKLLPFLEQGAAGIEKLQKRAKELGLTFGGEAGANAIRAKQALSDLKLAASGLGTQLAIVVAPAVTDLANRLTEMLAETNKFGGMRAGMAGMVQTLAFMGDRADFLLRGFRQLRGVLYGLAGAAIAFVAPIAKAVDMLNKLNGQISSYGEFATKFSEGLTKQAGTDIRNSVMGESMGDSLRNWYADLGNQIAATNKQIRETPDALAAVADETAKATEKAKSLVESLREQVVYFGYNNTAKEIAKARAEGVSNSITNEATALYQQLTALERAKKAQEDYATAQKEQAEARKKADEELTSKAKNVFEATRTPMEKYKAELAELQQLVAARKIDGDTFNRAKAAATQSFVGDLTKREEPRFASIAEAGSQAARSAILRAQGKAGASDPINRVVEAQQRTFAENQKQTGLMLRVARALEADVETFAFN